MPSTIQYTVHVCLWNSGIRKGTGPSTCYSPRILTHTQFGSAIPNTKYSFVCSDEELFKYFEENSQPETSRSISREKGISSGKIRYCIFQLAHAQILAEGYRIRKCETGQKLAFSACCKCWQKCFVLDRISVFANIFVKVNFWRKFL